MIVSPRQKSTRAAQYVALAGYVLFLGFPLLWMLSISFKGPRELVELHPHLLPSHATLQNYRDAITQNGLPHSAWNSFKVATLTALLTTMVGLPAAYVLARQRGLIARIGLGWILLSQMFPLIVSMRSKLKKMSASELLVMPFSEKSGHNLKFSSQ